MTKRFATPSPSPSGREATAELAQTVSALKKMLIDSGLDRSKVDAMISKASLSNDTTRPGEASRRTRPTRFAA